MIIQTVQELYVALTNKQIQLKTILPSLCYQCPSARWSISTCQSYHEAEVQWHVVYGPRRIKQLATGRARWLSCTHSQLELGRDGS